jgi:hypothetical protein
LTSPAATVEGPFLKFPSVFSRLRGRNDEVREFRALIIPTAEYCVLPKVDAFHLGFPEAASVDARVPMPNTLTFASYNAYGRGTVIKMPQVDVGNVSVRDVDFLAFDLLQSLGYDVVLGRSLLQHMRLELDFPAGRLRMEKVEGTA